MTRFVYSVTTLQFNIDPTRPYGRSVALSQAHGKDSNAADYIYTKSTLQQNSFRLIFPRLTDQVLADLLSFIESTVDGQRQTFTWYDHADTQRTVRFAVNLLNHRRTGPNRHYVEVPLAQEVLA